MKAKISIGVHERVKLYIVIWLVLACLFIAFFMLTDFTSREIQCPDGSLVTNEKDCPQCVEDSDCTADQTCDLGSCRTKRCTFDADCVVSGNQCIFGTCQRVE